VGFRESLFLGIESFFASEESGIWALTDEQKNTDPAKKQASMNICINKRLRITGGLQNNVFKSFNCSRSI